MLGIGDSTPLEFLIDGERTVLRVYRPGCVFCGGVENLREYRHRQVCCACATETVAAFEWPGGRAYAEGAGFDGVRRRHWSGHARRELGA